MPRAAKDVVPWVHDRVADIAVLAGGPVGSLFAWIVRLPSRLTQERLVDPVAEVERASLPLVPA